MFCVSKMEIIGCVRSAQFSIKSRFVNVWCVASTRIVLDEILVHTWTTLSINLDDLIQSCLE